MSYPVHHSSYLHDNSLVIYFSLTYSRHSKTILLAINHKRSGLEKSKANWWVRQMVLVATWWSHQR